MRRAVVLDPHPLWSEAVSHVLKRVDVEVVGHATTSDDALELVRELRPELLIAETNNGANDADGLACVSEARAVDRSLRVIVLSTRSERSYIQAALDAGATAYVVKNSHPDDLALAVRQAFRLSVYFQPIPARSNASLEPVCEPHLLTTRELEILALAADGLPNAKIAQSLWVTEQTVKFHLSNIYRKLRVSNRTEAARWAHVNGLVRSGESQLSVA